MVVTEALIIGSSATVVGLLLGLGVAAGLIAASRRVLENLSLGTTPVVVTPTAVLAAIALGMQAEVIVLDKDIDKLRAADRIYQGHLQTVASNTYEVERAVLDEEFTVFSRENIVRHSRDAHLLAQSLA